MKIKIKIQQSTSATKGTSEEPEVDETSTDEEHVANKPVLHRDRKLSRKSSAPDLLTMKKV